VGVDNIDMKLAAAQGIATVNTPGASTDAVALRTMTLIQAWAARLHQATDALREHAWPRGRKDLEPIDLSEKTLGVIGGCGRIGQRIRERAKDVFGNVLWTDIRRNEGDRSQVDLPTLLRQSDVVSVAVSGKAQVLGAEQLNMLKDGALLVNTSRGTNVDTQALLEEMNARELHAAMDVYPDEGAQMFEKNPHLTHLVDHPRFLGTAHSAVSDAVTQRKLGEEAAKRIIEFAREGTVNPAGLPDHTLPSISIENGHTPGVRALLFHQSVPGVLDKITHAVGSQGINIHALRNGEGKDRLAATLLHMEGIDPEEALRIMHAIEREVTVLRSRLMLFA
jgi:D-3-phosphoglycerate dehydrogenase